MRNETKTAAGRSRRPRHGTVIAYLALFVALGGSAFAAAGIAARDSVVSKSIKDGTIKSADVGDGGLTGADIAESTLAQVPRAKRADAAATAELALRAESADEAIAAEKAARADLAATVGPNAVTSDGIGDFEVRTSDLDFGAVGAMQLKNVATAVSEGTTISSSSPGTATVSCPESRRLIAGGYAWQDEEPNSIIYSAPPEGVSAATSWMVRGMVPSGSNVLYAWATCLRV